MFRQTLKNFYSLLIPAKKATADKKENTDPALSSTVNSDIKTARLLYHRDIKNIAPAEKDTTPHDWWIN